MTNSKTNPPLATLDAALDAFVAVPETANESGRVLAETAAALVEAQTEIIEEILPSVDQSLAAAEALMADADALEKEEKREGEVADVRAQLSELDEKSEE